MPTEFVGLGWFTVASQASRQPAQHENARARSREVCTKQPVYDHSLWARTSCMVFLDLCLIVNVNFLSIS